LQVSLTPPDVNVWRQLDILVVSIDEECRRLHGRYMRDRDGLVALCTRLAGHGEVREVRSQKEEVRRRK
jgi:hypothetical protein